MNQQLVNILNMMLLYYMIILILILMKRYHSYYSTVGQYTGENHGILDSNNLTIVNSTRPVMLLSHTSQ